jgi:hypothetical protein
MSKTISLDVAYEELLGIKFDHLLCATAGRGENKSLKVEIELSNLKRTFIVTKNKREDYRGPSLEHAVEVYNLNHPLHEESN